MNHSQELALIALREEALRMAREADEMYENSVTTEVDILRAPLADGEDLLARVLSRFEEWSEWGYGDENPNESEFIRRAQRNRDECRWLRRWIDGKL